jgi:pimeloyl-ACP methyl ester carboxylesterase
MAIESAGHSAIAIDYPSRKGTIEEHAHSVRASLAGWLVPGDTVSFVTHSMGGLVARAFASIYRAEFSFERAVMLAPPSCGSRSAEALARSHFGRRLLGPALSEIAGKHLPPAGDDLMAIGIVTAFTGLNRGIVVRFDEPNDGIVSISESLIAGARDTIAVRGLHTFIMLNRNVVEQTIHFLETGTFKH